MFNNTNVRFSNTAQVARTVEYLKENKKTKRLQYTPSFKVKVVDLMLEEMQLAKEGKDTYVPKMGKYAGKFSKKKFLESCGITCSANSIKEWVNIYNLLGGDTNINNNVCSVSRAGLKELQESAESKALGSIAKETNAYIRKSKELELKGAAKSMGFKLVKVA